ncbi:DUF84 family protein, partial [bacterium]|nr:DUF84 family protein [bacterium]
MKKVIIASKNPVKMKATKIGFEKIFPNEEFEYDSIATPDVSEQPVSSKETMNNALSRVNSAEESFQNADYWVGIDGGIERMGQEMELFAWIIIKSKDLVGKSKTGTFFLPKEVIKYIDDGKELGEATDIVFKQNNSKQNSATVGILTNDIIDRTKYYTEAIILALIPFKNKNL